MSERKIDPVTARSMEEDADFADEHTEPTFRDQGPDEKEVGTDESAPRGRGGDGGMDPHGSEPV